MCVFARQIRISEGVNFICSSNCLFDQAGLKLKLGQETAVSITLKGKVIDRKVMGLVAFGRIFRISKVSKNIPLDSLIMYKKNIS